MDAFFRSHPRLFLAVVLMLTAMAAAILLSQQQTVPLVYKAF